MKYRDTIECDHEEGSAWLIRKCVNLHKREDGTYEVSLSCSNLEVCVISGSLTPHVRVTTVLLREAFGVSAIDYNTPIVINLINIKCPSFNDKNQHSYATYEVLYDC